MDENLEKAIHDMALAAEQLGAAFYEEICEAAQHIQAMFSESMEELDAALSAVSAAYDEIMALAFDRIDERRKERKKWRRVSSVRVPALFIDRRKAVYHCRNSC